MKIIVPTYSKMLFRSHDACDDDDFVEDKTSRTEFDSHDVTI